MRITCCPAHAKPLLEGALGLLLLTPIAGAAQDEPDDGPSQVVPLSNIRETDAMWARRVWREIDLREKINHPLYFPLEPIEDRQCLFDVIRNALLSEGSITAYDPGPLLQDDAFTDPLTLAEIEALFLRRDTVYTEDLETGELVPVVQDIDIDAASITRYLLKEDWVFDKQRSVMDIRIIGLAPMREVHGEDGELRGYAPLFWLYFPELRFLLAQHEAFNRHNDAARPTFDNVFTKRLFSSTIVKVSNVQDRRISDHLMGADALLEAERMKQELFEFEHDLWHY
ncbi:MAG: gliding motility protein GldN [Flavobacteriales bacterium]|nr:gliding motility protein GldN [Flavobacteriales bacterium]